MARIKVNQRNVSASIRRQRPSDLEDALAGFGFAASEVADIVVKLKEMKQRKAEAEETKRSNLAGEAGPDQKKSSPEGPGDGLLL